MFLLLTIIFCNSVCDGFQPVLQQTLQLTRTSQRFSSIEPSVDEEDATFFFRASQQAAKDRYEQLTKGEDPFGLFGVSIHVGDDVSASDEVEDAPTPMALVSEDVAPDSIESFAESTDTLLVTSNASNEDSDSGEMSDSQYSDLLSSISSHVEGSASSPGNTPQDDYNFQRRLMESRFAMEKKTVIQTDIGAAKAKSKVTSESTEFTPKDNESRLQHSVSIAVEKTSRGPGCIRKAEDETEEKIMYRNRDELYNSMSPEHLETPKPIMEATVEAPLNEPVSTSSEDQENKVEAEPQFPAGIITDKNASTEQSVVNEENVAMGLLVLTRSFFILRQIVDTVRKS